ncbi:phosphate ABC transporter permease protein [Paucilactobacillus hokkaidonensis JCM 18461]|uniref:Phosphate transport system permease protein n=2 Tax=Paucilactobacillus hokkaidonensis TaxID=1193095 RepID=A0A0A1GVF1_9LACO|nr:phosphate ABC transporter permease subunit PstC [Paucilactobacillus hokkaidonensis]KRO10196.1 phosphate ABC transporter, permease [Paucilactobacillus hokkaidonensis]BAP86212.1 phosphate ABC transporter permease protein [Paucilactobacillus hokkaidonensis JCM 18461]
MDKIRESILTTSKASKIERKGKLISLLCLSGICLIVVAIFSFIAYRGLATFTSDHVSLGKFLTGTQWNPEVVKDGHPLVGALPMIVGSFLITILATALAIPFAIGTALMMTDITPKTGTRILQPVLELLVGIPSVVYGFVGLTVVVPAIRTVFGGSGFGILAGTFVLFVMVLPTITSMTVDSLGSVPKSYRSASLALGATRWQTIYKVVLRSATPGILTAIVFGMARAFGEALAVQMVVGNATLLPTSLVAPAATLTSVLTTGIGNTVLGTVQNDALWSLALILLLMSLAFNLAIHLIAKRGSMKL